MPCGYGTSASSAGFPRGSVPPKSWFYYWPEYYEERVPEKIDNLESILEQRPTFLNDFSDDLHLEKNNYLPYYGIWRKLPTVTYTSMYEKTFEFRRGGMAAKTRGGPLAYQYRRLWYYHKAKYFPWRYGITKIYFLSRRRRRRYMDTTYRNEFLRPEGPSDPVAPGKGGHYWKPGQLEPGQTPNSAYEPGGWRTWGKKDNSEYEYPIRTKANPYLQGEVDFKQLISGDY